MADGYVLSETTAGRLKKLLADNGGDPAAGAHRPLGRSVCLMRCDSATAAGVSGTAAQSYAGTILTPKLDDTVPTEVGPCWLTLWGSSGSVTPVANQVYIGTVSGYLDVDGDTRARVNAPEFAFSPLTTKGDLWGFGTADARIPVGTNTYVLTADSAEALGVKWAAVGGSGLVDGDYGDITVSAAATVWTIDDGVVTDAKLRDSAALSVIGRSANSTGVPADIAAGTDAHVLRRSGSTLGFGQVATGGITDAAVTDAKLRDSAALSVIGRSANSTGVPADIAAPTDDYVLRRSGTTLAFGRVATGGITDSAVTYAKIQNVSATNRILGRITSGSGVVEELTPTQTLILLGYPAATTAPGPAWVKVTIDYTDIATAATTADPVIYVLPAGAIIHHTVARCTTAWSGGTITDANLTGVGLINGSGGENRYLPSMTLFSAVFTAGSGASVDALNTPESFSAGTDIYGHFSVSGDNLDQATQGSVDIWFLVSQLP